MLQYREKQYRIEDVLPGMTLGEDIGHNSGKSILNQGAVLTEKLIQRLENWHIAHVVIREVVEPTKENRSQALEKQKDFKHNYGETVQIIKQIFDSTKACKDIPIKDLRELAQTKVKPFLNESGLLNNLYLIERNDNYLYQHSLDVAIIGGTLANWLDLPYQEVEDIILAGLLHDIGKVLVPDEILDKRGRLTPEEMEAVMLHSLYGSKLIKKLKYVSAKVNIAVLQHHERADGSGYPLKATCANIYLPAKVIAIADVYDAITSNRIYQERVSPFEAVATLEDMMGKLDISVCMTFLNNIKECFIGNNVLLSDGRNAKVIYWAKFKHALPIVQTQEGECISLEQEKLSIVDVIH